MNDVLPRLWAPLFTCAGGVVLGLFFFGGLWWTVRQGASARRPALWFLGSLVLRMGVALLGFYLVAGGQLARLGFCLLGFLVARALVLWVTRRVPSDVAASLSTGPPCA